MRIKIGKEMSCGKTIVPSNDYWVSLHSESSEIMLTAAGKDIRIKATRRKSKVVGKTTQVAFHSGGAKQWSVIVSSPKYGEWIAMLEEKS